MPTNALVVGSGGREHALAWKLAESRDLNKLYCAPGNAGTAEIAENLAIGVDDFDQLLQTVEHRRIDLTVIGPEAPLAGGLADRLTEHGHRVFGPTRSAARIESSKSWAKEIMLEWNVPTGRAVIATSFAEAMKAVERSSPPIVIKADGLAAGKGVIISESRREAEQAVRTVMVDREFGEAGEKVLIEEFLSGMEVSLLALTDGATVMPLIPACDYKRAGDGDTGLNTGGMGSYTPPSVLTPTMTYEIVNTVIRPALEGMRVNGITYQGVLYAGIILTADGPKVLEFNCRFGDPETQVVLPMLRSDFLALCTATATGELSREPPLDWHGGACVCTVIASGGYPSSYQTGYPITGLNDIPEDGLVFHAGTAFDEDQIVTAGGRVLAVVGRGSDMASARELAYATAEAISFENAFYRRDIALRELDSLAP